MSDYPSNIEHPDTVKRHFTHIILIVFTSSLILFGSVYSQSPSSEPEQDIGFEHITKSEGIPSDWNYSIVQNQQGFLWVGGLIGLSRYDGYDFRIFRHDPLDSTSISANYISALAAGRDSSLWVGTMGGGLDLFNPMSGVFTHYRHNPGDAFSLSSDSVYVILETQEGVLWVGTNKGLNRLNRDTGTFTSYRYDPNDGRTLAHDAVNALFEDRNGTLWVGTGNIYDPQGHGGGLNRFEPATDNFKRVLPEFPDHRVTAVGEDRDGVLYAGTCQGRLYRYDREQERLQPLLPDPTEPNRLHAPPGNDIDDRCSRVSFIHEDQAGMLWVGTHSGGLNRYDPTTKTLTAFRHEPDEPSSLSGNNVVSFYEDHQGILWVGTDGAGLNKAVPPASRFRLYGAAELRASGGISTLYEDEVGILWIGTVAGQLFRFDPAVGIMERFSSPAPTPDGLWGTRIGSIIKDREGMLWVGELLGLYRVDPARGTHTSFFHDDANPHIPINNLLADTAGNVWIGTFGSGISRYDPETGSFTSFQHDPSDLKSLRNDYIQSMYQDPEGILWIGTSAGGLNRYDKKTETFTTYLDGKDISQVYESNAGQFWVATGTDGLYLLNRETEQMMKHYTTEDGLVSDFVWGIAEDEQGFLWLASSGGLNRFDPATETFTTYNQEDGLDNRVWLQNLFLRSQSGMMYLGGLKGLTVFRPGAFSPNPFPPKTAITNLRVFEEDRPMAGTKEQPIRLKYYENELTFDYVGLHFLNPKRNRYSYYLDGYDKTWHEAGTDRSVTYTNLNPGDYTFRVKSASSDGVWDVEGTSLKVTILPPWWRTFWAYGIYGLFIIGGIFAVDRFQRRRLIRKEREHARERELAQAREIEKAHTELSKAHEHLKTTQAQLVQQEKMASLGQLTAGIAHEIKNPVNFVNNFAELNEELAKELLEALSAHNNERIAEVQELLDDLVHGLKVNSAQIAKHGRRADAIVQGMMQHALGDSNERYRVDLNALVEEYVTLAYQGKKTQVPDLDVQIQRDYDEQVGSVKMAPQEMGRVLLNLLGNAFDAVHEHAAVVKGSYTPNVNVSTRLIDKHVEVRVSDNGPGIPLEIREKIFEPFFTTKPTGSGTGLGLSMSYDIVTQGHSGTLTVKSEENGGATFIVTLPLSKTEQGSSA